MDANVNIQVSGMNTCGMYDAGKGYIWFVLKQIPDWEINAKAVYGMKNAVLTPVNTVIQSHVKLSYKNDFMIVWGDEVKMIHLSEIKKVIRICKRNGIF